MPHSLSAFVIPIMNGKPESRCFVSVNTSIPIVSGNKLTRNGKGDNSRGPLVGHCDSKNGYETSDTRNYQKINESDETTHLLCGKVIYDAITFSGAEGRRKDAESLNDNFRHYTIDPACMNIRLCIFWFLWAMLIAVLIVSILSYCCFTLKTCRNAGAMIRLNATNT